MSDATKTTGGPRKTAEPASSRPPAEQAEPATSQPPAKNASPTPATGDNGGGGTDGGDKGGGDKGGGGKGGGDKGGNDNGSWRPFWMDIATLVIFLFVAVAFVLIIASVFWPYVWYPTQPKSLLQELANTETARGLITFLVAVSTVSIAVILIVYLASSRALSQDIKDRFAFSKEVLTSLIGILGTIIGFYFGATQNQTQGHGTPMTLTLADPSITALKPGKGGKVKVQANLSGGRSPYSYVIRFKPDSIKEIPGDSPDGTIDTEIIHAYDPATPLEITLEALS
jgi:hypothetical protein